MNPANILINPEWTQDQKDRFEYLAKAKHATLAYWNSNKNGFPVNGGKSKVPVRPGLIQKLRGPVIPCKNGFHASLYPNEWSGEKVWICALSGYVIEQDRKLISSRREIIGEANFAELTDPVLLEKLKCKNIHINFNNIYNKYFKFHNLNLEGCNIIDTNGFGELWNTFLRNCTLSYNDFSRLEFYRSYFFRCDFSHSKISEDNVKWCYFNNCDIPKSWKRTILIKNGCKFVNCRKVS